MSAPINNQFAGGYQINEKEKNLSEFGNAPDENFDPLKTLDGEEIKADGGGMYASFERPKNDTNPLGEEIEEEENPEAELEAGLNEADDSLVESDAGQENVEIIETEGEHCVFGPTIDSCIRPGGLSPEEGQEAKRVLTGIEDTADISAVLAKANMSPTHKSKLTEVVEHLIDPETKAKNRENFIKDFGIKLEDFKEDNAEGEKEFGVMTQQAIDRLGSNYFVNLDTEGFSLDSSHGLEKAFETSIIEISLKADETTVQYKEIVKDIKDSDKSFEERFKRLVELEDYANTEVVKGGKKNKEDLVAANKRIVKNNNASEAFREVQNTRAASEAELHANNQALEESTVLNAPEETGGDIFNAGELDRVNASV